MLPALITILHIVFFISTIITAIVGIICLLELSTGDNPTTLITILKFIFPISLISTLLFSYISIYGFKESYQIGRVQAFVTDKWCTNNTYYSIRLHPSQTLYFEAEVSKEQYDAIIVFNKTYNLNYTTWMVRPNYHSGNKITSIEEINNVEKQ